MQPSSIRIPRAALVAVILCGLIAIAHRPARADCSPKKEVEIGGGKTKMEPRVGKPERTFGGQVLTYDKKSLVRSRTLQGSKR